MYRIDKRNTDKVARLLRQERKLFHTNDLALVWNIENRNTLYTTIKRYVEKGILQRIHKGFYASVALSQLAPPSLGLGWIHLYGYLSTETVLREKGIILQKIHDITLISSVSATFEIAGFRFRVRKMKDEYLYNATGIDSYQGYQKSSIERAVADLLYFDPAYYFDNRSQVNWKKVNQIQKELRLL